MPTYLDLHILQTVPPSNVNRDDTGSPKTAIYGGVRRARVSSQAWKRATRVAFAPKLDESQLGVRTTRVVALMAERIAALFPELADEAGDLATNVLDTAGIKIEKPKKAKASEEADAAEEAARSGYLMFLSRHQVDSLANLAGEAADSGEKPTKSAVKAALGQGHGVAIALFGRMVADDKDFNVDASVQVAHALSVHAVEPEFDYFTAVDDRNTDDAGAGMIGTVEFNSSTLYRYATINLDQLRHNLGEEAATEAAVRAFVDSFITSMPTGKQNTFANRTLPDAAVLMVRKDQPVNLVGAFEEPVDSATGSRLRGAVTALVQHARDIEAAFGNAPASTFVTYVGERTAPLAELGTSGTLTELVDHAAAQARTTADAAQ